jgi:hypothetical protein
VFVPDFVNYKKGCTRFAATSDKVYQLLAHGRWFFLRSPASSTIKTGRHDIAEILVRLAMEELKDVRSRRFPHRLILYTSGLYIEPIK